MLWLTGTNFMLYVLDYMNEEIIVIDPSPLPEWCGDIPYKKNMNLTLHIST